MKLGKRLAVEGAGTAWLVFAGCAATVLNASVPAQGCNVLEMAMAFGLALTVANYAAARPSSAHFNPAVTIGYAISRRFPVRDVAPYIAAQTIGAIVGAALLVRIASGRPGFSVAVADFASNGYDDHSPGEYALAAVFSLELVLTFVLVFVHLAMSSTSGRRKSAPVALGACLMAIYLVAVPVSNGGANPARSTAPALFVGDWALDQLWLFWAAPLIGGAAAGVAHRFLGKPRELAAPEAAPLRDGS
ncbi:aquaporin [Paraburkholderia acidisoli]|uniref:Aquaporin Z n=1 Tax=Paraburkholderia acidisoli TaxID=2571748 RepID=A0A7Z2JCX2_9BURK|nr:aquaporin [Paraburkholderia acidisoli]QGZ60532.1 aquaporin Z [Paraburkholderia acidisoli]